MRIHCEIAILQSLVCLARRTPHTKICRSSSLRIYAGSRSLPIRVGGNRSRSRDVAVVVVIVLVCAAVAVVLVLVVVVVVVVVVICSSCSSDSSTSGRHHRFLSIHLLFLFPLQGYAHMETRDIFSSSPPPPLPSPLPPHPQQVPFALPLFLKPAIWI